MDYFKALDGFINGPKAIALSGLTFALTEALKYLFPRIRGHWVRWLAFGIAVMLCVSEYYFREPPPAPGLPPFKEGVTLVVTALGAVYGYAKIRSMRRRGEGTGNTPRENQGSGSDTQTIDPTREVL
jgi:hypothetical protein